MILTGTIERLFNRQSGKTTLAKAVFVDKPYVSLKAGKQPLNLEEMLFKGGYPPLYDREVAARAWFNAYVTAYLERDVRQVSSLQDLEAFHRFVRMRNPLSQRNSRRRRRLVSAGQIGQGLPPLVGKALVPGKPPALLREVAVIPLLHGMLPTAA